MENAVIHKQYVELDEAGRIIAGWSAVVQPWRNTTNAVCIGEWEAQGFTLFPGGKVNPDLLGWEYMIPLYKWDGIQVLPRTAEEIEADRAAIPVPEPAPTTDERLAQLEAELARANAKNAALVESQQFLEECLVEMAGVVYA